MNLFPSAIKFLFALTLLSLTGSWVNAHGEDKPGPNKGFIKMPGAFHTELVPEGKNQLKVYLLDMNWKNPTVADSSLQVTHKLAGKSTALECQPTTDHYLCLLVKGINLKKGQLEVLAQRDKQKGNTVIYDLPFKLEAKKDEGHSHHH